MTNQASEDELDKILRSLAYDAMESGVDNSKHGYTYSVIDELLPTAKAAIKALIHSYAAQARIDELERLKSLHSRTYKQTVTDNMGNVYVEDSHGYISSYETQERIAELTKAKDQPDER